MSVDYVSPHSAVGDDCKDKTQPSDGEAEREEAEESYDGEKSVPHFWHLVRLAEGNILCTTIHPHCSSGCVMSLR